MPIRAQSFNNCCPKFGRRDPTFRRPGNAPANDH